MDNNVLTDAEQKLLRTVVRFRSLHRFSDTEPYNKCGNDNYHLKHSEFMLLLFLDYALTHNPDGVNASQLSANMGVKPPTINPLLSNLEKKGIITRRPDENDRRYVKIDFTPAGRQFLLEKNNQLKVRIHDLADYLGEQKSLQLAVLIDDIYQFCVDHRNAKEK